MGIWSAICGIIGRIMFFIYDLVNNYGLTLILFTIIIKLAMFPMSLKQHKGSLAMIRLKPYQDELMKKYGSNQQRYSEELQKLYQREGYNPMSSCLPLLIQMPLLFMIYSVVKRPLTYVAVEWCGQYEYGLWQGVTKVLSKYITNPGADLKSLALKIEGTVINSGNYYRHESLLLNTMGENAPIDTNFFGIDLASAPKVAGLLSIAILIPVLSGITSFLMSWLSQKMSPAQRVSGNQNNASMNMMMYLMPIMSIWIAYTVAAGLGLYWLTSNVLGIVQLFVLNKMYDPAKEEAAVYEKIAEAKQKEKEKRAAAASKKYAAPAPVNGKKKKKKKPTSVTKLNGEEMDSGEEK